MSVCQAKHPLNSTKNHLATRKHKLLLRCLINYMCKFWQQLFICFSWTYCLFLSPVGWETWSSIDQLASTTKNLWFSRSSNITIILAVILGVTRQCCSIGLLVIRIISHDSMFYFIFQRRFQGESKILLPRTNKVVILSVYQSVSLSLFSSNAESKLFSRAIKSQCKLMLKWYQEKEIYVENLIK